MTLRLRRSARRRSDLPLWLRVASAAFDCPRLDVSYLSSVADRPADVTPHTGIRTGIYTACLPYDGGMAEKLTVLVATKPLIEERAKAAGLSMGDYLDSLVRQDDLRARIQRDADTMAAAGLDSPQRTDRSAAMIAGLRAAR